MALSIPHQLSLSADAMSYEFVHPEGMPHNTGLSASHSYSLHDDLQVLSRPTPVWLPPTFAPKVTTSQKFSNILSRCTTAASPSNRRPALIFCVFASICESALMVKSRKKKVWRQHSYRWCRQKNSPFLFLTVRLSAIPLSDSSPSLWPGQPGIYTRTPTKSLLDFNTSNISFLLRLRGRCLGRLVWQSSLVRVIIRFP